MWKRLKRLGPYLSDLLLGAGGVCFVCAGGLMAGAWLALSVAGTWLTGMAILVARGKGAGGDAAGTGDPG